MPLARCTSRIYATIMVTSPRVRPATGGILPKGQWWDWDDAKVALEHLFWKGIVTATRRPNDFARVYDLTERVIIASKGRFDRARAAKQRATEGLPHQT